MRSSGKMKSVRSAVLIGVALAITGVRKGGVAKLIAEGNEHYRSGKLAYAVKAYNQALELDPENPEAWNNKGLILAVAGNFADALKCHLRAVELDPGNVDAVSNVGMVHTKLNNRKEALDWYDKALEMDPSHETTWNNRGNLLSKLGRYDEALGCYDRAIEINPEYMAAMNNKAVELIHLKRYDEALALLNSVLRSRPLFSEGWYVKGKAYVGMGEFDKAIICLERSHRLNPEFRQAKRALEILKGKLVEPPGSKVKGTAKKGAATRTAREKADRAIQKQILASRADTEMITDEFLRPGEHLTTEESALLAVVADEFKSLAVLKEAVGKGPGRQVAEKALAGLERKGLVMSRASGKAKEYARTQSLGTIQQEMVEQREEIESEDTGSDVHALVSRAKRYLEGGRHADAANSLRKALKINPYDEMAICLMAQAQFEMGQRDRAINTISRILVAKPDFLPAWFTLANASLRVGEYKDSAECFRKILELHPENAEARKGLEMSESGGVS